jgi:hypothetical protein
MSGHDQSAGQHEHGIDESWIRESREMDASRAPTIKLVFLYAGTTGGLDGVCTERAALDDGNCVTSDRLCAIIDQHKVWNGKRFVFRGLASFTVKESPQDFLALDETQSSLLRDESHMQDIRFADASSPLLDLSALFFVMAPPAQRRLTRGRRAVGAARTKRH